MERIRPFVRGATGLAVGNGIFMGTHMLNKNFVEFLNKNFTRNQLRKISVFFQIEHNLVLPSAFKSTHSHSVVGKVKSIYGDDEYLVRIDNLRNYHKFDFIFEYSLPNIHNIILSENFDADFVDKILYCSCLKSSIRLKIRTRSMG